MPKNNQTLVQIAKNYDSVPRATRCARCSGDGCDHCEFLGRIVNPDFVAAKAAYETAFNPENVLELLAMIDTLEAETAKVADLRTQMNHWKGEAERYRAAVIDQGPLREKLDRLDALADAVALSREELARAVDILNEIGYPR